MTGHLFETERLIVRQFRTDDAHRLYAIHREDDPYGSGMLVLNAPWMLKENTLETIAYIKNAF